MRDTLILVLFCFLCYPRLLGEPLRPPAQGIQRCLDCKNADWLADNPQPDRADELFGAAAIGSDDAGDEDGGGCAGALVHVWREGLRGLRADCAETVERLRDYGGNLVFQLVAAGEEAAENALQAAGDRRPSRP